MNHSLFVVLRGLTFACDDQSSDDAGEQEDADCFEGQKIASFSGGEHVVQKRAANGVTLALAVGKVKLNWNWRE